MLFNSIFQNLDVSLLCIKNTPTMLYAARWMGRGGGGGNFLNFLDSPLDHASWFETTKVLGRSDSVRDHSLILGKKLSIN